MTKIINTVTALFFFLFPIFFLPFPNAPVETDKQMLLILGSTLIFFLVVLKSVRERKVTITATPFDKLLFMLALVFITSALLFSPNKMAAFSLPLGAGTILSLILLFFSLTQTAHPKPTTYNLQPTTYNYFSPLLLSSSLLSVLVVLGQLKVPINFSPAGDVLSLTLFLSVILIFIIADLIFGRHGKKLVGVLFKLAAGILVLSAVSVLAYHLVTDWKPLVLPFWAGWQIMMEVYKNIGGFLLGVGPADFSYAFHLAKPIAVNSTPFWNLDTAGSTSYILTIAAETGIIAVAVFIFFLAGSVGFLSRSVSQPKPANHDIYQTPYLISLITALIFLFIFPVNLTFLILVFILMAFAVPKHPVKLPTVNRQSSTVYILILLFFVMLVIYYWQAKIYLSDIYFRLAVVSANNGGKMDNVYNLAKKAIILDPDNESRYSLESEVALAIARDVSQNEEASKSGQTITALTQQALADATTAVAKNSTGYSGWGKLAATYQALIGIADKADQSALDAYTKQISLDPFSPLPRVAAGGLLLQAGNYEQALNLFSQAANLKPDWNSIHYNLAVTLKLMKRYPDALSEYQRTLSLTPQDSGDYKKVQSEMEEAKKLIPTPTGTNK